MIQCLTTNLIFKEQTRYYSDSGKHLQIDAFVNLDGGASRDRTDDPLLAKQMLSQLSYGPGDSKGYRSKLVGLGGFEPPTPRLSSVCSNQLSYRPGLG